MPPIASFTRLSSSRAFNLLFRAPAKLHPIQGYRSFRYNFIQSTCKLFHVLGLRNEEYSPKTFSCSHASYTWSDRNFCPVSLLEFVSKRPRYWDAAIIYWVGGTLAPLLKSNAVLLFQTEHGNDTSQERIKKKMPRRVKKRRKVQTDDGVGDKVSFQFAFFSLALEQAVHFDWREKRTARNRALSRDFLQNGELARRLISTRFFVARPLPVFTNLLDDWTK